MLLFFREFGKILHESLLKNQKGNFWKNMFRLCSIDEKITEMVTPSIWLFDR